MQFKFRFLEAVQARSRRIPKAEWVKHKEDIIREYKAHDLSHAIEWMASNRDFHASTKQYEHQLKRWDIKKYRKTNLTGSYSKKISSFMALSKREEPQESQQVNDCSASSLAPVHDSPSIDGAHDLSGGTPSTTTTTESTSRNERESQSENMSASPSATSASVHKSIDDRYSAEKEKSTASSVRARERASPEPRPSESIDHGGSDAEPRSVDPTLDSGPLSPGTSSFLDLAQRISQLKRGKPSAESLALHSKKPRRTSWGRQWSERFPSVDSLSDAVSSLNLGSRWQSRRASVERWAESDVVDSGGYFSSFPKMELQNEPHESSSYNPEELQYSEWPSPCPRNASAMSSLDGLLLSPSSSAGAPSYRPRRPELSTSAGAQYSGLSRIVEMGGD